MPQFGRFQVVVRNPTTGAVIPGASVQIRLQGATLNAGSGPNYSVADPGAIVTGHTVAVDTGVTTAAATVNSAVSITTNPTLGVVVNNARLTIISLPTLYLDAEGAETISNPLQTDANGVAACWIPGGKYDVLVSGSGLTNTLYQDVPSLEGDTSTLNLYGTGAGVILKAINSWRTLTGVDRLLSLQNNTVEKFYVQQDGKIVNVAGGATIVGNVSITGTLSSLTGLTINSGGFTATGNSTINGSLIVTSGITVSASGLTITSGGETITAGDLTMGAAASRLIPGATSFAVRNNANGRDNLLVVNAGDVTAFRDHICRRLHADSGTTVGTGNFAFGAGWGTGGSVGFDSIIAGSKDSRGEVIFKSGTGSFSINPTVTLTFADGVFNSQNTFAIGYFWKATGTQATIPAVVVGYSSTTVQWQATNITPTSTETWHLAWMIIG